MLDHSLSFVKRFCPITAFPVPCAKKQEAGQKFTADFVLDKGACIKEYRVNPKLNKDTVWFFGEALQDYCDEFPDTANVEKSVSLKLGDYDHYTAFYNAIVGNDEARSIVVVSKNIVVRK